MCECAVSSSGCVVKYMQEDRSSPQLEDEEEENDDDDLISSYAGSPH